MMGDVVDGADAGAAVPGMVLRSKHDPSDTL
jgi:hypothetical protein